MKRRDLFKFAAVGAAGLLVPSTVSYFLPPLGGWGAQRLRIRHVQQYTINTDEYISRYDACWDGPQGPVQYYVQMHLDGPLEPSSAMSMMNDRIARLDIETQMRAEYGVPNSDKINLHLPRGVANSRYL